MPQVNLELSQWLQALMIALKYKKELTEPSAAATAAAAKEAKEKEEQAAAAASAAAAGEASSTTSSSSSTTESAATDSSTAAPSTSAATVASSSDDKLKGVAQGSLVTRFYTCPLDQVLLELDQMHHDGKSFGRLFTDQEGSELQFSQSMFEMMNLFSQATYRIGLNVLPDQYDERIPLMVWQSCAFTIHSIVWSILDQGKSLFGNASSRQSDCLSTLVRFCGIVGSNFGEPKVVRSHSLKLLSTLLEVDTSNLSVLEFDAFGLLVDLTFSLPSLFNGDQAAPLPSSNIQDLNTCHLLFVVHLVQILLTTDQFSRTAPSTTTESSSSSSSSTAPIMDLFHIVREAVGFASDSDGSEGLSSEGVWADLKVASLPFLRCSALFYHHLSSIPAAPELQKAIPDPYEEFDELTKYLCLPNTPAGLLESPHLFSLSKKWANHPNVHIMLSSAASTYSLPVSYPIQINSLIQLPKDYSELINSVSLFTCPKSRQDESRVPAMCLICGQMMCSQSYCCQSVIDGGVQVGACTAHAQKCGAGNGIFLRVRECKVVLVSGRSKGCFISPPYLDQYGETDTGLRRGNPLTLCPERYRKIHRLWLNHAIPGEIAHNLESNQFLITTPWQHL